MLLSVVETMAVNSLIQDSHSSWKILEGPVFFSLKFQDLESPENHFGPESPGN